MKKTRFAAILLALSIATSFLAACSDKEETTKKKKTKKSKKETTESVEPTEDTEPMTSESTSESTTESTTESTSATSSSNAVVPSGGNSGSVDFDTLSDRIIEAAKSVCDAKEADSKQKGNIITDFKPTDGTFDNGAYTRLSPGEIHDLKFNLGYETLDPEDIQNFTAFVKSEPENTAIVVIAIEATDPDAAADMFEDMLVIADDIDAKRFSNGASDVVFNISEENDRYMFALYSEEEDISMAYYCQIDGTVLTLIAYNGTSDTPLLTDFYDFMREAELPDMEAFLAAGQGSSDPSATSKGTNSSVSPSDLDSIDISFHRITADEFTSKLEAAGFTVIDNNPTDPDYVSDLSAYNQDLSIMLTYKLASSTKTAKDLYNGIKDNADLAYADGEIEAMKSTDSFIVAIEDIGTFVVLYTEDMIIAAMSDYDIESLKECFQALGFEIK
ncbi:MAG: hypothetical protein IK020_05965 [Clostridiales bacterium]|nr:hypothetical protein [Clostridiales bacterium]